MDRTTGRGAVAICPICQTADSARMLASHQSLDRLTPCRAVFLAAAMCAETPTRKPELLFLLFELFLLR